MKSLKLAILLTIAAPMFASALPKEIAKDCESNLGTEVEEAAGVMLATLSDEMQEQLKQQLIAKILADTTTTCKEMNQVQTMHFLGIKLAVDKLKQELKLK